MMGIPSFKVFKVDVECHRVQPYMVTVYYVYRLSMPADHPLGPYGEAASLDHSKAILLWISLTVSSKGGFKLVFDIQGHHW